MKKNKEVSVDVSKKKKSSTKKNKNKDKKEIKNIKLVLIGVVVIGVVAVITILGIVFTADVKKNRVSEDALMVADLFMKEYEKASKNKEVGSLFSEYTGVYDKESNTGMGYSFYMEKKDDYKFYYINKGMSKKLGLSSDDYVFEEDDGIFMVSTFEDEVMVGNKSFVAFDGKDMVVCLVVNDKGKYYDIDYANENNKIVYIFERRVGFKNLEKVIPMWGCSLKGVNSWS